MLERFKYLIFGIVIVAITGGIVALLSYRPPPMVITINPPPPTATLAPSNTPAPSATPGPLRIYVTGAVTNPFNTYTLPRGSRVADAVDAAGGFSPDADRARINLAQPLSDGEQVNVPGLGDNALNVATTTRTIGKSAPTKSAPNTPLPISTAVPAISSPIAVDTPADTTSTTLDGTAFAVVHVNTATSDELQRLPGCGPSTAQAIIDYRTKNGPFKSMDDLGHVPRIGPKTLEKWTGKIVFD